MVPNETNENEQKPGTVIILSGPVGAGKTTVARQLIKLLPGSVSYIEGDTFWSFIAKTEEMDPRINFRILMRAMTAAAGPFARFGYTVLLDFSIPSGFLSGARKILKDAVINYVMLKPAESVCAARAANRRDGAVADYEQFQFLYSLFEAEDRYIIRNDETDSRTVSAMIMEGLSTGRFLVT